MCDATWLMRAGTDLEPSLGLPRLLLSASAGLHSLSLLEDPAISREIQIRPRVAFLVFLHHCPLPGVDNGHWLCQMLLLGEAG